MRRFLSVLAGTLTTVVAATALVVVPSATSSAETVTPGSFTGYGFDTCHAPTQQQMDVWRVASPYRAVGIYVSGNQRACRSQPNLTPTWVSTQAARGWRFLPIHVGLQAPCRVSNSKARMSTSTTKARAQGIAEAGQAVAAAGRLGIARGSYLYLDMEQYDIARTSCNNAVLAFTEGWTDRIEALSYKSGVYSSASAAIRALDRVRADPARRDYNLPGHLWMAWGNGRADTDGGPYLGSAGWRSHQRIHQFRLDVSRSYGGVRITVDDNYLDVGKGSVATAPKGLCNAQRLASYPARAAGASGFDVKVAECLLRRQGLSPGTVDQSFSASTTRAVQAFQRAHGQSATGRLDRRAWTALLAQGSAPVLKHGHVGRSVWRVQNTLRAAGYRVPATGVWDGATTAAIQQYRARVKLPTWPTAEPTVWRALQAGR